MDREDERLRATRARAEARRDRFLNARQRTIGVDVDALDAQVAEHQAKGEAESLAGFILELTKGFPKKDEIVIFGRYHFVIESFQGKRINQIKLTIQE